MSSYEQRHEAHDKAWQYLLFHAEPYQIIAFKIPSQEIDKVSRADEHWSALETTGAHWRALDHPIA